MPGEDFETQVVIPGVGGIDLKRELDLISALKSSRLSNLRRATEGGIEVRPGLVRLATAGTKIHSIFRLNDSIEGIYTRLWGVDDKLYAGRDDTAPLALIASGFSGHPLTGVPYRPPASAKSWFYIADEKKMVKVRIDGTTQDIGLSEPVAPPTSSLDPEERVVIEDFGTPGLWTPNAGSGGVPAAPALTTSPGSSMAAKFSSNKGTAKSGYFNYWGKPISPPVDMTHLGASGREASDDDQIQVWVKMDRPDLISEIKIYLVVSNDFDGSVLPGASVLNNTNSYFKSFRPSDFTESLEQAATGLDTTGTAQARALLKIRAKKKKNKKRRKKGKGKENESLQDIEAALSLQAQFGRDQWIQIADIGFPLRRGEFLRIGTDTDLDLSKVYGIVVVVNTDTNENVVLSLDDLVLTGGYGPDSTEPGSTPYNYVYRNFHLLTGARSNPSPIQGEDFELDALRRGVRVAPAAYGNSYVRQQFFRRGGTLVQAFYFVGTNESDGGSFLDQVSDASAVQSGLLQYDNDRPVTTYAEDGGVVRAQPLPSLWGPIRESLLGCGDPYRPSSVYWSKPGEPDHWPLANNAEVCAPSEELLGGLVYESQAFVFSRERLHGLVPTFVGFGISFVPVTTSCDKGTVSRWSFCVTPYGIAFVAFDGIYMTTGSTPLVLTDDDLWGLFHNEIRNGYFPVDWDDVDSIRLEYHDNELWFLFKDTEGGHQAWIFYFGFKFWRHYGFGKGGPAVVHSEEGEAGIFPAKTINSLKKSDFVWLNSLLPLVSRRSSKTVSIPDDGRPALLIGGVSSGRAYIHDGFSDDGDPIFFRNRTGALNQGLARENKIYGDVIVDADRRGVPLQVQTFVNEEATAMTPVAITSDSQADPA